MNEFFDLSLLPSVIFCAILAVKFFDLISPIKVYENGRNSQIDGLRGLLALFVFVHHSVIWKGYIKYGVWKIPDSNFFTNIGQLGVSLFLMITGYLFFTKIRKSNQNWIRLYTSRFFRLTPMFALSLLIIFFIVGVQSGWQVKTSIKDIVISISHWLPFTFLGVPNINGLNNTFIINAGVTWTLVYEWFFYFSLPLIAFLLRRKVRVVFICISLLFVMYYFNYGSDKTHLLSFACGFAASYLREIEWFKQLSVKFYSSIIVMGMITFELFFFKLTYSPIPILICGLCFSLICSGCSVFGILNTKMLRKLGEATYSIYLLHGIVLYILINRPLIGPVGAVSFQIVCTAAFIVTFLSCFTYKCVELPFIRLSDKEKKPPVP